MNKLNLEILVALRNLLQERGRLVISTIGVAFAVALILLMQGIYVGVIDQFTRVVSRNPTDVFVAARGIQDFFHGVSVYPRSLSDQLRAEPEVGDAIPMLSRRAMVSSGDSHLDLVIFSYFPDKAQGRPWAVEQGTLDIGPGETLVSKALAKKLNKKVGDTVTIDTTPLKITGLVPDASALGAHYICVRMETAKQLVTVRDVVSFTYLTLRNPAQAKIVTAQLQEKFPQLALIDKEEFLQNNQETIDQSFLPIIQAILIIAVLIGIAVIGLTIYTATIDKAREYGVLKAIGVTNLQLYRTVAAQAILVTVLGTAVGIGLSALLALLISDLATVTPKIGLSSVLWVWLIALGMGLIASLVPTRRLGRIDPAEVFKS